LPKASITFPASAFPRINLVEEIFNDNRNKVAINSNDGKIENCKGSFMYIAIISIISDNEILIVNNKSIKKVGIGIIINNTIDITAMATIMSPNLNKITFPLLIF